jgi:trehalose synthase
VDDIRTTSRRGADLSYDFLNRPAYHHALATGDTEFLRLTLAIGLEYDVQPVSLVHSLQNHDELTYELVHFAQRHADELFPFRGKDLTGRQLADLIRRELTERLTGPAAPYNAVFTTNGISSTTASVIAASLGYRDIRHLTAEQVQKIKQAHLLLAMFNAWQPGVFALSGWDLCGVLPLEPAVVAELIADGDTRWIHRGAYDLMAYRPEGGESLSSLPRAPSLYGPLPAQLADVTSFASQLRQILAVRASHGITTATQLDVVGTADGSILAMIHELDGQHVQATLLNFSAHHATGHITSEFLQPGDAVTDLMTGKVIGRIRRDHGISVSLPPHHGLFTLVDQQ